MLSEKLYCVMFNLFYGLLSIAFERYILSLPPIYAVYETYMQYCTIITYKPLDNVSLRTHILLKEWGFGVVLF